MARLKRPFINPNLTKLEIGILCFTFFLAVYTTVAWFSVNTKISETLNGCIAYYENNFILMPKEPRPEGLNLSVVPNSHFFNDTLRWTH